MTEATDGRTEADMPAIDPDVPPTGSNPSASNRRNVIIVVALALTLALAGLGYLAWASRRVDGDLADREAQALETIREFESTLPQPTRTPRATAEPEPPTGPIQPVATAGEVIVINRVPGDDYGRLAIRHADGTRTLLDRTCMRVHVSSGHGVCVSQNDGLVPTYTTTFFDAADPYQRDLKSYASALPSRVRISPDGSLSTVTAFVTGTSYEDISGEATTIVTIDEFERRNRIRGANQFEVLSKDSSYQTGDRQFWGLSFENNDEFFITGFFGETPEIMSGSLDTMSVTPTGHIGSCPSLSPDGRTLVYKAMRPEGGFDLVAVDLETDEQWELAEKRSVDDQVEWLDDDTILYALHPEGREDAVQPEFDIWTLDIAPGSEPVLFLPNADSPAVIR